MTGSEKSGKLLAQLSQGKEDERGRSQCYGTARSTDFSRSSGLVFRVWLYTSSCRAQIVVCCPVFIKQDHLQTAHAHNAVPLATTGYRRVKRSQDVNSTQCIDGRPGNLGSVPVKGRHFSLLHSSQVVSEAHPTSFP